MIGQKITGGAEAHTRDFKEPELRIISAEIKRLAWLRGTPDQAFKCYSCGIISMDEAGRRGKHEPLCWNCADTVPQRRNAGAEPFIYGGITLFKGAATRTELRRNAQRNGRGTV